MLLLVGAVGRERGGRVVRADSLIFRRRGTKEGIIRNRCGKPEEKIVPRLISTAMGSEVFWTRAFGEKLQLYRFLFYNESSFGGKKSFVIQF